MPLSHLCHSILTSFFLNHLVKLSLKKDTNITLVGDPRVVSTNPTPDTQNLENQDGSTQGEDYGKEK